MYRGSCSFFTSNWKHAGNICCPLQVYLFSLLKLQFPSASITYGNFIALHVDLQMKCIERRFASIFVRHVVNYKVT